MRIVVILFLVVLGVLGIAGWLKRQRRDLAGPVGQLETIEGWIGIAGLIWGVILLLRWIAASSVVGVAAGVMLIALINALVITALSLILAMGQLRALFGANDFTNGLARVADRLLPFKIGLGFACLVLALYQLLGMMGMPL